MAKRLDAARPRPGHLDGPSVLANDLRGYGKEAAASASGARKRADRKRTSGTRAAGVNERPLKPVATSASQGGEAVDVRRPNSGCSRATALHRPVISPAAADRALLLDHHHAGLAGSCAATP